MGSGNVRSASARFGFGNNLKLLDEEKMLALKRNKEVEAIIIHDQKVEESLKIKKLLLLGETDHIMLLFLISLTHQTSFPAHLFFAI